MNRLSIKLRLLASNLGAIAFVVLIGGIGYFAVTRLDAAMDRITSNGAVMKDQMAADQVHDALRADVLAALLAGAGGSAEERDAAKRDTAEHIALFRKLMAGIDKDITDPALRAAVGKVRPDVDAYLQSAESIVALALSDVAAARQAHPAFMQRFRTLEKSMGALSELIEAASAATRDAGDATVAGAERNIAFAAVLAALLMLATGTLLSRSISRPLDEAIVLAGSIAEGRLDADIACIEGDHTETGQLKRALRSMRDSLRRIVGEVRGGTDSIATAAGQIAAGNSDLSSRTES